MQREQWLVWPWDGTLSLPSGRMVRQTADPVANYNPYTLGFCFLSFCDVLTVDKVYVQQIVENFQRWYTLYKLKIYHIIIDLYDFSTGFYKDTRIFEYRKSWPQVNSPKDQHAQSKKDFTHNQWLKLAIFWGFAYTLCSVYFDLMCVCVMWFVKHCSCTKYQKCVLLFEARYNTNLTLRVSWIFLPASTIFMDISVGILRNHCEYFRGSGCNLN